MRSSVYDAGQSHFLTPIRPGIILHSGRSLRHLQTGNKDELLKRSYINVGNEFNDTSQSRLFIGTENITPVRYIVLYCIYPFLIALLTEEAFQKRSRPHQLTLSEFTCRNLQATVSEGLAQGLYMAARAGFKPMTLWSKGIDSTNAPPRPITLCYLYSC